MSSGLLEVLSCKPRPNHLLSAYRSAHIRERSRKSRFNELEIKKREERRQNLLRRKQTCLALGDGEKDMKEKKANEKVLKWENSMPKSSSRDERESNKDVNHNII